MCISRHIDQLRDICMLCKHSRSKDLVSGLVSRIFGCCNLSQAQPITSQTESLRSPSAHHKQLIQLAWRMSEDSLTVGRTGLLLIGFIFGLVSLLRTESSTQLSEHPHVTQWAPLPIWHVLLHVASHLGLHLPSIPCCPAEACPHMLWHGHHAALAFNNPYVPVCFKCYYRFPTFLNTEKKNVSKWKYHDNSHIYLVFPIIRLQ